MPLLRKMVSLERYRQSDLVKGKEHRHDEHGQCIGPFTLRVFALPGIPPPLAFGSRKAQTDSGREPELEIVSGFKKSRGY